MSHLRFATRELQLLDDWCAECITTDTWTIQGPVGSGESGSVFVVRPDGLRGIAKPALGGGTIPRAAHEKIASDLAKEIGIPVPPVTLWTDQLTGERYAISAMAFPQTLTWDESASIRTSTFTDNCTELFAAAYVLHHWIGDTDHSGHGGNVVVDADSDEKLPGLAFIDHAFSMTYAWTIGAQAAIDPIPQYYCQIADLPRPIMVDVITRVRDVSVGRINDIVRRIPADFLSAERAETIVQNLIERREHLSAALGL